MGQAPHDRARAGLAGADRTGLRRGRQQHGGGGTAAHPPQDGGPLARTVPDRPPGRAERRAPARSGTHHHRRQVEEVVVRTLEEVPAGATHWSKREPAKQVGISPTSVLRIWRALAHPGLQDLALQGVLDAERRQAATAADDHDRQIATLQTAPADCAADLEQARSDLKTAGSPLNAPRPAGRRHTRTLRRPAPRPAGSARNSPPNAWTCGKPEFNAMRHELRTAVADARLERWSEPNTVPRPPSSAKSPPSRRSAVFSLSNRLQRTRRLRAQAAPRVARTSLSVPETRTPFRRSGRRRRKTPLSTPSPSPCSGVQASTGQAKRLSAGQTIVERVCYRSRDDCKSAAGCQ